MDAYTVAKEYFKDLDGFEVTEIMNGQALDIVLSKNGAVASKAISKFTLNMLPCDLTLYLDTIAESIIIELNDFLGRIH